MPVSVVDLLVERVRRDGSRPLLTYYHPANGERVEFNATSFANWVDKTAGLIDQNYDTDGVYVAAPLSVQYPAHWMSLIWPLATWQSALYYWALPDLPPEACALVVTGPDNPQSHAAVPTVACSLHPLGLGLAGLPDGVLDFTTEALAQPDGHWQNPIKCDDIAWFDASGELSVGDWLELRPQPGRVLVRSTSPRLVLAEALARPLLGGGSAVIVDGPVDDAQLARIAADERVDDYANDP